MRLLVTRPKEDAAPLIKILKAQGHEPVLFPLLKIKNEVDGAKALHAYKAEDIQALIVTSANGVRAFAATDKRRSFKVMAVGDASARAAQDAGFQLVESASGDVETLSSLIKETCDPKKGIFLHIAGSKVAGNLKGLIEADGFVYERVVLYSAEKVTAFSAPLKKEIFEGKIEGVLLYSPRTAVSFVELLEKDQLKNNVKNMVAYGLSAAVRSKIKDVAFKEIIVALTPDQDALLSCLPNSKDEPMTTKKDDNKKDDPKVIDAKAEDVKVSRTDEKETAKKPASKTPQSIKPNEKKKAEDPVEKALKAKAASLPKKKGSFKAKLLVASVVILAGAGVAGYYTQEMWVPKAKAEIVELLHLDTVVGASGEQLAAVTRRLEALEGIDAPQQVDIKPLLDKISELEGALSAVKSEVSTIEISNSSSAELGEIKELVAIKEDNQRLSQLVTELNTRLADLEAARVQIRSTGDNAQALIAALSSLREVVRTSSNFEAELKTLVVLSEGDVTLEQGVETLKGHAGQGIASTTALMTSFNKAANDIVRATVIPDGAGWVEATVKNITSLVSIRRAPGHTEGDSALGIVARAEMNVQNGDLAAAVTELSTLEGKSLEAAKTWMDQATARLGAERSLSVMQSHILTLLSRAGGQG